MTTLTAMAELSRLYAALAVAHNRTASLGRDEEITEIRAAIKIAKGNVNACRRADAAIIEALLKGNK